MNLEIPIITYHSINDNNNWLWGHLSTPIKIFRDHMKYLKEKGYKSISLDEYYLVKKQNLKFSEKSIIISFDDGYYDNWINAYPILKEYGFSAVIWISPEFIEDKIVNNKSDRSNKNVDNISNEIRYLNWYDLKNMENTGYFDVQSHTMTHTWYERSCKVIGFNYITDEYPWKIWNNNLNFKPIWPLMNLKLIGKGQPVFEYGPSITTKTIKVISPKADRIISKYVKEAEHNSNYKKISKLLSYELENLNIMKTESDKEYINRLYFEIANSKEILESKMNKKISFLCWPNGAFNDDAITIAKKCGYLATTKKSVNNIEKDLIHIKRIGIPVYQKKNKAVYGDSKVLNNFIKKNTGSIKSSIYIKLFSLNSRIKLLFS